MNKHDILMGIMTAVFFIMCGIYIKTDMDKYKIKPCEYEKQADEQVYSTKEPVYTNDMNIIQKQIQ